jgi:hypothetical protein
MKNFPIYVALSLYLTLQFFASESVKEHSVVPKEGFVPTKQVAIEIAVAIWKPIYGKEAIEKQKPYKAYLKNGTWYVFGHQPPKSLGGVAIAEIQKEDAKILRVNHSK